MAQRLAIPIFVGTTLLLTGLLQYPLFGAQPLADRNEGFVFAMMWCPAVAALVTAFVCAGSLAEIGWRLPRLRYLALGLAIPLLYTGITYATAWHFGFGAFNPAAGLNWANLVSGWLFACLFAFGEEIGWRGFLVPALAERYAASQSDPTRQSDNPSSGNGKTRFAKVSLVSGAIWAVWHYPLILQGSYGSGGSMPFMLVCFTLMLLGINIFITWLRLSSGSLWPSVIMHGTHNLALASIWSPLTIDTGATDRIVGEFGLGLAIVAPCLGVLFVAAVNIHNGRAASLYPVQLRRVSLADSISPAGSTTEVGAAAPTSLLLALVEGAAIHGRRFRVML